MAMFVVTVVPRGAGAPGAADEPKTLMIDAPTSDEARLKVASRGLKAIAIRPWQDPSAAAAAAAAAAAVAATTSPPLPPPSYVRADAPPPTVRAAAAVAAAGSRPGAWRASQDCIAAASLAARYPCWLGVVLTVYGGICAYGAMGIPGLFNRQAFWADRWIRGITIWMAFLAPAIVCFFLAAKVFGGAAWSFIAGIAVSGIAALGMSAIVLLCLFGLPATLTPLLVAFIPLVLSVANVVYATRALAVRAIDPARQP
jgi:hypothetical protein